MRVSSEEQRQRQTIQTQQEFLSEYARVMELEVVDTYPDDGVLGTIPLEEKSEGRRLLEDAKAGKFDTVLVYKPDRLDEHSSSSWRHTISLRRSAWRFGAPTRP